MYQGIKNVKNQSAFFNKRIRLATLIMAVVLASSFWSASQVAQASGHLPGENASSTSMDHKGMSMDGKSMSMDSKDMSMDHKDMAMGSKGLHELMMKNMQDMQSMSMNGNTDQDFAMMMKMHHQGAVDMAKIEIRDGKDAELKAMAQKIVDSQQAEIKEFEEWQQEHKSAMPGSK